MEQDISSREASFAFLPTLLTLRALLRITHDTHDSPRGVFLCIVLSIGSLDVEGGGGRGLVI